MSLPQGWRASVPVIHIPRHPLWTDAYDGAWDLLEQWAEAPAALRRVQAGASLHFALYAFATLPLYAWLDQLYEARLSPLNAWLEWSVYQLTGDTTRLARALPVLLDQYTRLRATRRHANGLYYKAAEECDMVGAPRSPYGWIDLTAQQALAAELCARIAREVGSVAAAEVCEADWKVVCAIVEQHCWNDYTQFYSDCGPDGVPQAVKTVAGLWPLLAGSATPGRAQQLAAHLERPEEFWRVHVFAGLSADHPRYSDRGEYRRGAVWPFQNYAIIKGLERYGMHELARRAADNHLTTISHVYKETRSHWDHYAPDYIEPGTTARHDAASAGVGAVALLIETILGLHADAPARTLHWRPTLHETYGIERLRVGSTLVSLRVEPEPGWPHRVQATVRASEPFSLHLSVPAGERWVEVVDEVSFSVVLPPTSP